MSSQPYLTPQQLILFQDLAQFELADQLLSPFIPIPKGPGDYVIYLSGRPNYQLKDFGDLDALCAAGLVDFKLTRMGNSKQFQMSKLGLEQYLAGMTDAPRRMSSADALDNCTHEMRVQLSHLMSGVSLQEALIELTYVKQATDGSSASRSRIQHAMQTLGTLLIQRFASVPLVDAAEAMTVYARWCEAVAQKLG